MSTSNEQKNLKLRIMMILISLIFLMAIFYSFSDKAINLYEKYLVNDHHEVVTYLEKLDLYNNDSTQIVDSIRVQFNNSSEGDFYNEVKVAQKDLQKLIDQTAALTPPKGFSHHKEVFLAVVKKRMGVLSVYNKTRKTYEFQELNNSARELNQMQEREREELLQAFNNEGIKYKLRGDGSIRFWLKGYSAKSINR